jgi:hypothetical protein
MQTLIFIALAVVNMLLVIFNLNHFNKTANPLSLVAVAIGVYGFNSCVLSAVTSVM